MNAAQRAAIAISLLALCLALVFNLNTFPSMRWDEGWTTTVARTWVERGTYGRLLEDQLAPSALEAALPITGPVALSFRLFGVGVWQARLPGVIVTVGALALIYYLASQFYERQVAVATLAVLLLMSVHAQYHTIVMGRQALGEMPMLFFMLAAYACLLWTLRGSLAFWIPAVVLGGIAVMSKAQTLPFWTASLLVPLSVVLLQRRARECLIFGSTLVGSLLITQVLFALQRAFIYDPRLPPARVTGIYEVTAYVFTPSTRVVAFIVVLVFGLPALLGLVYALRQHARERAKTDWSDASVLIRLALLTAATTWLMWYLVLANALIARYLFPALFLAAPFTALWLQNLTNRFDLQRTLQVIAHGLRELNLHSRGVRVLAAVILVGVTIVLTLQSLAVAYAQDRTESVRRVADWINEGTSPSTRIETYDSELFFFLERPYHYPPDQLHVELNRYKQGEKFPVAYDPLADNPDYLVVGPTSRLWGLYEPVLVTNAFQLVRTDGEYEVYRRVR